MNEKFNPNKFKGCRKKFAIPGNANIRRIYIWDVKKQRYIDPPRGNKYEVRKSVKSSQKREEKTFETLFEARDWLNGTITNFALEIKVGGYSIGDLLNDWQRLGWGHLSKSTKIFYDRMFAMFEPLLSLQVEALHPKHIDEWIHLLKSPAWSSKFSSRRETFEKEYGLLKAVITWYIDRTDETKLRSPFKKRHIQMLRMRPAKQKTRKAMYDEELALWLKEVKKESYLFYVMAVVQVHQVLRVSEVCAMKWSNLNLVHREYTVAEHVIWPRVNGASAEILPGTKTNKSGEVFKSFLQRESVEALTALAEIEKNGDLIFNKNGSVLTYRQVQHAYDQAFKRLELPFRGTHVCRHSGATSFLDKTGDVLALQQMGAWRTQQMAMHYGQISSSRAKEATLKAERKADHLKLVSSENVS
ncbi:MAG: tyrosine-type recombinase/integrase [Pseudobdellovibrio sp.]